MKQTNQINYDNQLSQIANKNDSREISNTKKENISLNFDRESIIQGLIFSEILGKPRSKRRRR